MAIVATLLKWAALLLGLWVFYLAGGLWFQAYCGLAGAFILWDMMFNKEKGS